MIEPISHEGAETQRLSNFPQDTQRVESKPGKSGSSPLLCTAACGIMLDTLTGVWQSGNLHSVSEGLGQANFSVFYYVWILGGANNIFWQETVKTHETNVKKQFSLATKKVPHKYEKFIWLGLVVLVSAELREAHSLLIAAFGFEAGKATVAGKLPHSGSSLPTVLTLRWGQGHWWPPWIEIWYFKRCYRGRTKILVTKPAI